jgi:MOSC domain-containing protein YiiM
MFQGKLEAIFIGPSKGLPMQAVDHANAIAGAGLEGDRYSSGSGTFSKPTPDAANKNYPADRQITLIEAEALDAAARDYELTVQPDETRRNLLVRGVPLNHLVGQEFLVGDVRLRGLRLCEPCGHLEKLTALDGIKKALLHRGGLRAEILTTGELHPNDTVRPA